MIDLTNFNTKNAVDTQKMFYNCSSLESLNILNFDTEKVITMEGMFNGCSNLQSLHLSNFNTTNVNNYENIFKDCNKINYINLLKYVGKDIFKEIELDYKFCINSCSQIKDEDSSLDDKINDCFIYINKVKIIFPRINLNIAERKYL